MRVSDALRRFIEERAGDRCEYCRAPQQIVGAVFHIEHVNPTARGGTDDVDNLALSCSSCNLAKGAAISGLDPETGRRTRLFNPRTQRWEDHLAIADDGVTIVGRTATGSATIHRLAMNSPRRLGARAFWRQAGLFP